LRDHVKLEAVPADTAVITQGSSEHDLLKKIEALFTPNRLDSVRDVMNALGIDRYLVSELGAHEPEQLNT